MANQLKMALIETIATLHRRGWSQRRIARELNIDRETVGRYLRMAKSAPKPAIALPGSAEDVSESKPAIAPPGSEGVDPASIWPGDIQRISSGADDAAPIDSRLRRGRSSVCEPWRAVIQGKLAQELSAQRIYQDLVLEHGYAGSYYSVRRFVDKLDPTHTLPVRRLECAPGEEAQVDFGTGAWIRSGEGKRRRTHVFRIVLSHSRKAYSEAVYRQTTDEFIRCLENAFWHFGGVPRCLVLDNLKAAVNRADWFDPDINPKFASFCQHYGMAVWPTRPRRPEHKGKVERGVGYVQDNSLKAREFCSLEEHNRHLFTWETTVADRRIHGTTRQQVGKHFDEVERAALQPLPPERFPFFHEGQRTVNRDGHIEVDRAYYSVPPEHLGRRLWVRWDSRLVRIYTAQMQSITVHIKREPGRFSTHRQHIAAEKISVVEHGADYLLTRIRRLGPEATCWAESMMQNRGIEGIRVLQGLWSLTKRYRSEQLAQACAAAQAHGCYRLRTVRALVERHADKQTTMSFLEEHPLIRPLADYEQFIHHALQKEIVS
jgi:transposase